MTPDHLGLLTVDEAAATAGVAPATIRCWLRRYPDRIRTERDRRGRLLLSEADILDVEHDTRATRRGRPRTVAA
jgi:predicted transcriptional regulator of viral defense system